MNLPLFFFIASSVPSCLALQFPTRELSAQPIAVERVPSETTPQPRLCHHRFCRLQDTILHLLRIFCGRFGVLGGLRGLRAAEIQEQPEMTFVLKAPPPATWSRQQHHKAANQSFQTQSKREQIREQIRLALRTRSDAAKGTERSRYLLVFRELDLFWNW